MKALLTAFALLSFVAASTVPVAAQAAVEKSQTASKKKPAKKAAATKTNKKKTVAKKKPAKPTQQA